MVLNRNNAAQVASGARAIAIADRAIASGTGAICLSQGIANATGFASVAIGEGAASSGIYSLTIGRFCVASAPFAQATGTGVRADRTIVAYANGSFGPTSTSLGDAQQIRTVLFCKTTDDSATEMFITGATTRLTVPSGKVIAMLVNITGVKSDGSAVAHYVRQYAIKNVGGTTTEVYAPVTIGTDNAASTSISLSANDTNDALKIEVTGIASETWRWVASVDAVEVAYGT
jgi:hypothetical protein